MSLFQFISEREYWADDIKNKTLTLFDMGGGHDGPKNVFNHCAETLRRRKLKLCDFYY